MNAEEAETEKLRAKLREICFAWGDIDVRQNNPELDTLIRDLIHGRVTSVCVWCYHGNLVDGDGHVTGNSCSKCVGTADREMWDAEAVCRDVCTRFDPEDADVLHLAPCTRANPAGGPRDG